MREAIWSPVPHGGHGVTRMSVESGIRSHTFRLATPHGVTKAMPPMTGVMGEPQNRRPFSTTPEF